MTALLFPFVLQPSAPNEDELFAKLFAPETLIEAFQKGFETAAAKGVDRLNGFQFKGRSAAELTMASRKCLDGSYRFAPYLEILQPKGRHKLPRLIGIPTIRDRVVLNQLNLFLAALFPERVPKNVASQYVREILSDLKTKDADDTWVCGTDIKTFYDSIRRDHLEKSLRQRIKSDVALKLILRATLTPTVPKNSRRRKIGEFKTDKGVPQGLAVSNILAAIYMQQVDVGMRSKGVTYYRYVDDVLMYGSKDGVTAAYRSLRARLASRGLSLHSIGSGKTTIEPLKASFSYLGYTFKWPTISVRDSTIERFLQTIAAKFSDYKHNKSRRLDRYKYLNEERLKEIFLMELNERISGAVSERRRYGWIAYFNEITDLSLLHRLDHAIASMFTRLNEFENKAPSSLRKLSRAYYEMKFNPQGGYVRDYDKLVSRGEILQFLLERGRIDPNEALTDGQIADRFAKYKRRVLASMHADESFLY